MGSEFMERNSLSIVRVRSSHISQHSVCSGFVQYRPCSCQLKSTQGHPWVHVTWFPSTHTVTVWSSLRNLRMKSIDLLENIITYLACGMCTCAKFNCFHVFPSCTKISDTLMLTSLLQLLLTCTLKNKKKFFDYRALQKL